MKTKTKILVTLLSIFVILAGMMDMPANTYTPTGNTSATRFGYELPGYMDGHKRNGCWTVRFASNHRKICTGPRN